MPWAMLAIAAIQMGMSMKQQEDQKGAISAANTRATKDSIQNQSMLTEKLQKNRRRSQGASTMLGGPNDTPQGNQASLDGTLLGDNNQKNRSLLGG